VFISETKYDEKILMREVSCGNPNACGGSPYHLDNSRIEL